MGEDGSDEGVFSGILPIFSAGWGDDVQAAVAIAKPNAKKLFVISLVFIFVNNRGLLTHPPFSITQFPQFCSRFRREEQVYRVINVKIASFF
jgi:hypothetical protein